MTDTRHTLLLLVFSMLISFTCIGQIDWKQKLTLNEPTIKVDHLLEKIQATCPVFFAFAFDGLPKDLRISIHVKNESLLHVVNRICLLANLSFDVKGDFIIFTYEKLKPTPPQEILHIHSIAVVNATDTTEKVTEALDTMVSSNNSPEVKEPSLSATQPNVDTNPLPALPLLTKSPASKKGISAGLFFYYGLDYNSFDFIDEISSAQKFSAGSSQTVTAGIYFTPLQKLYLSMGAGISSKEYYLDYNYKILDNNDPFPIPARTSVTLRYLEIPLVIGYTIVKKDKMSLIVSLGASASFRTKEKEVTTYLNKGTPDTQFFIGSNSQRLSAATLGFIYHHFITTRLGCYVEPTCLYFFDPVNSKVMQGPSIDLRLKVGMQFVLLTKFNRHI